MSVTSRGSTRVARSGISERFASASRVGPCCLALILFATIISRCSRPSPKSAIPAASAASRYLDVLCHRGVLQRGEAFFFLEIIVRSVVVTASETDAVKLARRSFFVPLLHALRVGFAPWFFALVRSPSGSLLYDKVLGTGSQRTLQPLKTSLFIKVCS